MTNTVRQFVHTLTLLLLVTLGAVTGMAFLVNQTPLLALMSRAAPTDPVKGHEMYNGLAVNNVMFNLSVGVFLLLVVLIAMGGLHNSELPESEVSE